MRFLILAVGVLVASAVLIGCAEEGDAVSAPNPVEDTAQVGSDVTVVDVEQLQGDATGPDGDASETLLSGPDDEFSQAGCALMQGEKTAPIAGSTAREAGQQVLLPNYDSGFVVALPESGIGFVTLEVPDWQVVLAVYTTADVELVLHDPEDKAEVVQPLSWAAPCAEQMITEERTKFHKWGGFTLEIRGEPGGEAWLAAIDLPLE